jgi:hypothetical protein
MKKLMIILAVVTIAFSPVSVLQAQAGQGKVHKHHKGHHHGKHHKA